MRLNIGVAAMLAALLACGGSAADGKATAEMKGPDGKSIGTLTLTAEGEDILIQGELAGLTPGEHAFHIHETGKCDGPDFKSAGGHYNPENTKHGKIEGGSHAGDMDNLVVGGDGSVKIEVANGLVSLKKGEDGFLLDDDGSAIVIHAKADDYKSQPAGDAGGRVACGVIQ